MPTTPTALGAITAPTDADPVELGAQRIRELAAQLDRLIKVKTADLTRNNSAALVNVADMSFPVAAGKSYAFRMVLFLSSASATPDANLALTFPAGTCTWGASGLDTAATSATASAKNTAIVGAASGAAIAVGVPAGVVLTVIEGTFVATANGTVQLQYGQAVATASDSKLNAGSYLEVKLAA